MNDRPADNLSLLGDLIAQARRAGADAAEASIASGTSLSVQRRAGRTEHLERSEARDLALRVYLGRKAASVSASAVDPGQFPALVERAIAMARVVPEDIFAGLAEDAAIPPPQLDLDLVDPFEPHGELLIERAEAAEAAAMAVAGVTNSEGAGADYSRHSHALVTSAGFAALSSATSHSISATALAGSGTEMQRDYDYSSTTHFADQKDPEVIGRSAGERAVARLRPQRPQTARLPVIYDKRVSTSLVNHLLSAINGAAVARGTSFLKEALGTRLFPDSVMLLENPHKKRGLRSRAFDGEGVATHARRIIDGGVLTTWLLDSRSARQLKLRSTGHARGTGNLSLAGGTLSPAALMADITLGIYVTELIGTSVSMLTGDYSRGAAGFMIRNGVLAEPVAEITIAGNLRAMFQNLTAADDLEALRGVEAPTIRIEGLTLAGA